MVAEHGPWETTAMLVLESTVVTVKTTHENVHKDFISPQMWNAKIP